MYEYVGPGGKARVFSTAEEAWRKCAEDGYPVRVGGGSPVREIPDAPDADVPDADAPDADVPDADAPDADVLRGYPAAIVGFADEGALVYRDGVEEPGEDQIDGRAVSYYTDAGRAREIFAWLTGWAPDHVADRSVRLVLPPAPPKGPGGPNSERADGSPGAGAVARVTAGDGPRTVAPCAHSAIAEARIAENDAMLARWGVVQPPGPTTSAGIRKGDTVASLGYRNLATYRREWEAQPTVGEQAAQVESAIRAEAREDWTVRTSSLTMRDDGCIDTGRGVLAVEPQGFAALLTFLRTDAAEVVEEQGVAHYQWATEHLGRKARLLGALDGTLPHQAHALFPRAAQFLLALDPDARANAFNVQMSYVGDRELVLRTRQGPGPTGRALFAAVSPGYTPFDADEVARVVSDGLGRIGLRDARGEVLYSPDSTSLRMDAFVHAPPSVTDLAAGDVFKAGLRFRSDDAGGGSVRGSPAAWWNQCYNLLVIHQANGEDLFRLIHRGETDVIDAALRRGIADQGEILRHFARQWGILRETPIEGFSFRGETYTDVRSAVEHLVLARELDHVAARDVIAEYVLTAHQAQGGGDTLESILQAMTRAAHASLLAECARERLEGAAGRLVPVLARAAAEA